MVFHHTLHVQRLQVHRLVLTDDLGRRLVQVVAPDVLDFQVHPSQFLLGSLPVLAPFLFAGQSPLSHLDPAAQTAIRLGVFVSRTITTSSQRLDAKIDTDFGIDHRKNRNVPLHGDADVILPRLVPTNGTELDLALDFTVFDHPNAFEELRDDQFVLDHLDVLWDTERLVGVLRLEDRELAPASEEVVVPGVETLERELEALRVHFLHPRQGLLQPGQVFAVPVVVTGFLRREVLVLACG